MASPRPASPEPPPSTSKKRHSRRPHRNATENDKLIRRVAFLFCFGGDGVLRAHSYREIADGLGPDYTPNMVRELVCEAIDRRYLMCVPAIPYDEGDRGGLEQWVKQRFDLVDARVVPGDPTMFAEYEGANGQAYNAAVNNAIVAAAAEQLDKLVRDTACDQMRALKTGGGAPPRHEYLAVSWGRTTMMLAKHLSSTKRSSRGGRWLECVPAIGIQGAPCNEGVEANIVARDVARVYGIEASQLPCPAFLTKDNAAAFRKIRHVAEMLKKIRDAKILVTSLGPILSEEHDDEMTISPDADITAGIAQRARQLSAVGEIMGSPFDAKGQPIPIDDYEVMGVDVTCVRKIAADPNRRVLLLCGGNPRKVEALDAALRGRLVSILVSDTETVRQLQARDDARRQTSPGRG